LVGPAAGLALLGAHIFSRYQPRTVTTRLQLAAPGICVPTRLQCRSGTSALRRAARRPSRVNCHSTIAPRRSRPTNGKRVLAISIPLMAMVAIVDIAVHRAQIIPLADPAAAGNTAGPVFGMLCSSTWWKRACGACRSERLTSGIESFHCPPISVPLTFGWARTLIGEASRGDLTTTALIRYRAAAMRVGGKIQINHVEGELTSARGHGRQRKCRWA
jgi:hypothetical protein